MTWDPRTPHEIATEAWLAKLAERAETNERATYPDAPRQLYGSEGDVASTAQESRGFSLAVQEKAKQDSAAYVRAALSRPVQESVAKFLNSKNVETPSFPLGATGSPKIAHDHKHATALSIEEQLRRLR